MVPFTRLGRYQLIELIGEGGMAFVYAGRSLEEPTRPVALKIIHGQYAHNREFVAMFLDEARIAARLAHPNIVELLEFGHEHGRYFLALELVFGQSLVKIADACGQRGVTLPFEVVAWIGARVADALHHAHELRDEAGRPQHVVHRDVNPSNILVTYEGQPKVIDFGLARAEDRIGSTRAGIVKGKLAYLAPEQARSETVDRRADVFGLGVTLWELSVGRRLFKSDDDLETLKRVLTSNVPDPSTIAPGCPPELGRIILRAAARDASERYATAAELARDLDAVAAESGKPVGANAVADRMTDFFPTEARPPWERAVSAKPSAKPKSERASVGQQKADDRMLVWDEDARKMTYLQMESFARPDVPLPPAENEWIRERLEEGTGEAADSIASARANLELAVRDELFGNGKEAKKRAEAALALEPTLTAAHATLRRVLFSRKKPKRVLAHLDAEIAAAPTTSTRADLAAERARILSAAGEGERALLAAWDGVLSLEPEHPAALKGRERVCRAIARANADERATWANHLARMAEAFSCEKKLAAWLHVERARVLDEIEGGAAAKAALDQALALDPGLGPVRDACVRRASAHRDTAALVTLLAAEAEIEPYKARAARLELDAACLSLHRLADTDRALQLLCRARGRAPTAPSVDRRVLDELVRQYEAAGSLEGARLARRARVDDTCDPRSRAHDLRCMAGLAERANNLEEAVAHVESARAADPSDATLTLLEDRLLGGDTSRREALWVAEAERRRDPAERARAWQEAARIAELAGRRPNAVTYLHAAVAAQPGDADLAERLAAFAPLAGSPEALERVRERVAVYARAAERTQELPRRVAYLEKIALLWEEVAADTQRAAAAYEEILALEPRRIGAVMGLERTAARAGDGARRARALLDEAHLAQNSAVADAIRVRAAEALARSDSERARSLLSEVLARRPDQDAARALLVRLFEEEQRWGDADAQLAARIEHTKDAKARAALLVVRAELQKDLLGAVPDAVDSLRHARAADAEHPALADAILECVAARGDARALRDELVGLAESAPTDGETSRHWTRAAELDEMVLLDDEKAEAGYEAALGAAPDDAWIAERLARVRMRLRGGKLGPHDEQTSPRELLERALALVERGQGDEAQRLVDAVLAKEPNNVAALRVLEELASIKGSVPLFANALEQQIAAFSDARAKLGALWAEAALVEWELPESPLVDVYARILDLRGDDRAALDGALRHALALRRSGDATANAAIKKAAEGLLALGGDASSRFALHLTIALVLDPGADGAHADARAALGHYGEALALHARSPSAAIGAARLGAAVGDTDARVTSARALADLAKDGVERAGLLAQAASLLLLASRDRVKRGLASELLEQAAFAAPNGATALGLLSTVLEEDGQRDRLIAVLRKALSRASANDAIVTFGRELARVARKEPTDWGLVVDALLRVREAAPGDCSNLAALAEAYAALRAFPEAAETLETLIANEREGAARTKALFQLVEIYDRMSGREADVERVLRALRAQDPHDQRAAHSLLAFLRKRDTKEARAEIAVVLESLVGLEQVPEARAALAVELARARVSLSDRVGAERAFAEALAQTPTDEMLGAAAAFAPSPRDRASLLAAASVRATERGYPSACLSFALAALEIDALGQVAEGVAHTRFALALEPEAHEGRALLARGLAKGGKHAEAAAAVLGLIEPDATPLVSLVDPSATLQVLEGSLTAEGRPQEALVARELRAVAGAMDEAKIVALRSRRLPPGYDDGPPILDAATLREHVLPADARSVFFDVVAAIAGTEARVFAEELDSLGLTARDRTAQGHTLWPWFERARRALGVSGIELAECDGVPQPRVITPPARFAEARATPWVIVPPTLASCPEPVQQAALARVLTRIALGTPWLDQLDPEHVRGLLIAAMRLVVPSYANDLTDGDCGAAANEYTRPLGRGITRAQKKALATLAPDVESATGPTLGAIDAFVLGARRTEARVAFLLTGDALATLDELGTTYRGLRAAMADPIASDIFRFGFTPIATALRRQLGAVWT
jgi:serine/threonine protein kinase